MRFDPLSPNESRALEREMLKAFDLTEEVASNTANADGTCSTQVTWQYRNGAESQIRKAQKVLQAFNAVVNDEDNQPATLEDAITDVRYKMGYGWWAWFFIKNFAIPLIQWLWFRYHSSSPEKPIGSTV